MASSLSRIVSAAMVGNIIEIYDLSIYGFMAPYIAINYFPHLLPGEALFNTFAIFFIGFLARPLGSLIFGYIGDRRGRKAALVISIVLMAAATCMIGMLPTFRMLGPFAAVLLVVMRLFQGFSVGGEYLGSSIFLVEHAPDAKRGLYGGFAMLSGNFGLLIAVAATWVVSYILPHTALQRYGWRLPFLLAIVGGIIGLWMRLRASETRAFQEVQRHITRFSHPLIESFVFFRRALLSIVGLTWLGVVSTYLIMVFMPTYLRTFYHYHLHQALAINLVALVWFLLWIPLSGWLSDRYGRRIIMSVGALGLMLGILPYYWCLSLHSIPLALLAQCLIVIPLGIYCGVTPTCMVEMVPPHVRFSASTFGYNVGAALFGGTTPLIALWLIHKTHSLISPGWYVIACGLCALWVIYCMEETATSKLKPIGIV